MLSGFLKDNTDFTMFGQQHLVVMALLLAGCITLPLAAKHRFNERQQLWVMRLLLILLAFWVVFWIAVRMWQGYFSPKTDLPLDVCNMMALALPLLMWRPRQQIHGIVYFWIMGGTIQAVITPHLYEGFPHFTFFKYWIVHGGLIVAAIYITIVFNMRPTWRNLFQSFAYIQGYALFVLLCNILIGSNYMYLLGKPPTASPLDYLGPWPWYLLVVEAIALLVFAVAGLPLLLRKPRQ